MRFFPYPNTLKAAKNWISRANKPFRAQFAIVVDGKPVGGIGFDIGKNHHRKRAVFGYWLSEKHWGKGIMSEATRLVTDYGFKKFKLARIEAYVYPWNPASQRVLIKNGFRLEGILRNNSIKSGKIVNELVFSKIKRINLKKTTKQ